MSDIRDLKRHSFNQQPTLRVTTRPNDANANGGIFGGWLMSQIDIAGSIEAIEHVRCSVATIAVKSLQFIKPLFVGDLVSFYTQINSVGRTSVTVDIKVYAQRMKNEIIEVEKVADATFVYVAIESPGVKKVIEKRE